MKKIYFALAVLGTAMLASCVQEVNQTVPTDIGTNGVAFSIGGVATRSAEEAPEVMRGVTIPLGKTEDGTSFYLEESVIELDDTPITRGTPAYTENIGVLYKNQLFVHADGGSFTDATFENLDTKEYEGGGWRYQHTFTSNPWPAVGTAVDFYLHMPVTMTGVSDLGYSKADNKGSFTFTYQSPAAAKNQQDILFGYTSLDKSAYNGYLPAGAPVLLNHALTGVKFAIGNDMDEISFKKEDKKIAITEISFKGLKDYGECVITPINSGTQVSKTAAVWNPSTLSTELDSLYSGTFQDTVCFENGGSFGENGGPYPDRFVAQKTGLRNLNDAAATQTFWIIPQEISSNVRLAIKYIYDGKDCYWTVDLGSVLAGVKWEAGQIRTYTIKINEVNVKIDDTVNLVDEKEEDVLDETTGEYFKALSYSGSTKTAVTISNTGNTDAFIRVALVGQWLDDDGNPVFGFTDYGDQVDPLVSYVDSWYQDQFVTKEGASAPARKHGQFVGLVGYDSSYSGDWVYDSTDGYYYYTKVVKVGESVPSDDPLFTSYKVGTPPAVRVAGNVKNVYFELQIATQAISAKKLDGSYYTYSEAWGNAKALNEQ